MNSNRLREIFDGINDAIRQSEASLVNLLSAIAPWGAPLPAAFMSYQHMDKILLFPPAISIPVAFVIEILGFSTVSTIISFWMHNKKYTDDAKKSPVWLVIVAFTFYLFIVLTMNVLIDASNGQAWQPLAITAVRGLLTLMSIPAALVLAVRTQHQEILNESEEAKRERAFKRHYGDQWFEMMYGKQGSIGSMNNRTHVEPTGKMKVAYDFISQYVTDNSKLPTLQEIMIASDIVKSAASNIRTRWIKDTNYTV